MVGILTHIRDWQDRRRIIADIKRSKADQSESDRFIVKDNLTFAVSALERDDHDQAERLWCKSVDMYPAETRASPMALRVLLGLRRFGEAESLMLDGQKRYPKEVHFARGLAEIARARGDRELALQRWKELRNAFPGTVDGYTAGAAALTEAGRIEEADALADRTIVLFPEDMGGYLCRARIAMVRENWELALAGWQQILDRFNKHQVAYPGAAQSLIQLGRFDEADTLLTEGRTRYPIATAMMVEFARSAQARGDNAAATFRWKELTRCFPNYIHGYFEAAVAFVTMAEPGEAETMLRAATVRFEKEPRPWLELARFLDKQENFSGAANAWSDVVARFPDDQQAYLHAAGALVKCGRPEEAKALREDHRLRFHPAG